MPRVRESVQGGTFPSPLIGQSPMSLPPPRATRASTSAALVLVLVCAALGTAHARKPEDVFGGKIMLSDKQFSTQAKSASAFIANVKKQSKDRFWEDQEKTGWKIHYAAFFQKPLNDLEYTVSFFDTTSGEQRLVESYEQYTGERGQRSILGSVKLKKGEGGYSPNARILMVMANRGRTLAKASFYIQGESKKYTGKVTFTEEEAASGEEK